MSAGLTKYFPSHRKMYAAGVFTLALLVLLLSCPLKQVVNGNFIPGTSGQKFARSGFSQSHAAEYKAEASCCALKKKDNLALASATKVDAPSGLHPFLPAVQGFGIHYFLSRLRHDFAATPSSLFVSLPLFLQHLRLLI